MTIKITKKIVGYSVVKSDDNNNEQNSSVSIDKPSLKLEQTDPSSVEPIKAEVIHMHERLERPDVLVGATYKIKSPLFEHALYVTINDIVLNRGTEHELRRPFEIFINSKNMDHFQWIVALTRIMSAVFRKGGDVTFLVEELKAVFDPRGGYFKTGGVYMNSIVAELGVVIEEHLKMIGLMHDPETSPEQKKLMAEKRTAYESQVKKNTELSVKVKKNSPKPSKKTEVDMPLFGRPDNFSEVERESAMDEDAFPATANLCHKCHAKAVIIMDGCATCLNCGHSKCG